MRDERRTESNVHRLPVRACAHRRTVAGPDAAGESRCVAGTRARGSCTPSLTVGAPGGAVPGSKLGLGLWPAMRTPGCPSPWQPHPRWQSDSQTQAEASRLRHAERREASGRQPPSTPGPTAAVPAPAPRRSLLPRPSCPPRRRHSGPSSPVLSSVQALDEQSLHLRDGTVRARHRPNGSEQPRDGD